MAKNDAGLGPAGVALMELVEHHHPGLDDVQRLLLAKAARLADRIDALGVAIQRDGAVVADRWGCPKPHAGLDGERKNLIALADLVRRIVGMAQTDTLPAGPGADLLD